MVDVNKPVENPVFVAAMEALQQAPGRETEAAFFEALRKATFLFVLQEQLVHDAPDADGKITLKEKTKISFPMLSDSNGQPMHFGFTDWSALYGWKNEPNQQTLIVPFEQLSDFVLSEKVNCSGFFINPSTHNFFLPKQILASLSGFPVKHTVEKETKVLLGEPADYPQEMVDALKVRMKGIKEIKKAWLMLMHKDGEESYLVVLEHTGDRNAVSQAVGQTASPHLKAGMFVDIVMADDSFGQNAIKDRKPFYKRGLFG